MEGVVELAEEVFDLPVSLNSPTNVPGLESIVRNPMYSTGVGLMMFGKEQEDESPTGSASKEGLFDRVRRWFGDNV